MSGAGPRGRRRPARSARSPSDPGRSARSRWSGRPARAGRSGPGPPGTLGRNRPAPRGWTARCRATRDAVGPGWPARAAGPACGGIPGSPSAGGFSFVVAPVVARALGFAAVVAPVVAPALAGALAAVRAVLLQQLQADVAGLSVGQDWSG